MSSIGLLRINDWIVDNQVRKAYVYILSIDDHFYCCRLCFSRLIVYS